ncbi:MAG: FliA/WhiG family RNA polymerase sigma factor [Chloroflexota bacterium]
MEFSARLWKQYTQDGDHQARHDLILYYAKLVKFVVGRLAIGLPPSLQEEDLIGFGTLGLIEAVDRFDPNYGVKFETYAVARIRGQIIDSLRAMDMLPRSAHRQAKEIESTIAYLSQDLGRSPTENEIADYLGISLEQYHNWLLNSNCTIVSLDRPIIFDDGEQSTLYDSVEDTNMLTPTQEMDNHEMKTELISAILALPEREQMMISLYYNDGLTMKEIGQVLNVSESRVSQIHAKAMLTLRGLLKHDETEPRPVYQERKTHARVYAAVS